MKRILAVLSQKTNFEDFAIQELKSLLTLHNLDVYKVLKNEIDTSIPYPDITRHSFKHFPYITLELEDLSLVPKILNRAISILHMIHLIGNDDTYEQLF